MKNNEEQTKICKYMIGGWTNDSYDLWIDATTFRITESLKIINSTFSLPIHEDTYPIMCKWNEDGHYLIGQTDNFGIVYADAEKLIIIKYPDVRTIGQKFEDEWIFKRDKK